MGLLDYKDLKPFLNDLAKKNLAIETEHIANWFEKSENVIIGWALKNKAPFTSDRKHIKWDKSLLSEYINPYQIDSILNENGVKIFYFDVKKFLKYCNDNELTITTRRIVNCIGCCPEYIQRWAQKHEVPINTRHGNLRNYIWDENSIKNLADWINKKHVKINAIQENDNKPDIIVDINENDDVEEKIRYYTTKQALRLDKKNLTSDERSSIRYMQGWAKMHNVPMGILYDHRSYLWTNEMIKRCGEDTTEEFIKSVNEKAKKVKKRSFIQKMNIFFKNILKLSK